MAMKRRRTSKFNTQTSTTDADNVSCTKIQTQGHSLTDLPKNIVVGILLKLSVKRILVCKCVCKTLYDIISDPEFAKFHSKQAEVYPLIRTMDSTHVSRTLYLVEHEPEPASDLKFCCSSDEEYGCYNHTCIKLSTKLKLPLRNLDLVLHGDKHGASVELNSKLGGKKKNCIKLKQKDHKYKLVNACNGFLCLSEPSNNNPVVVCNPVTGEFINLPKSKDIQPPGEKDYFDCGFGFSPLTKRYKVIRMFNHYAPHGICGNYFFDGRAAEVHALGAGTWKRISCVPSKIYRQEEPTFPTYLNGALYWFYLDFTLAHFIVCFDMDSERFLSVPTPKELCSYERNGVSIGILGGCLCICDASNCYGFDVWVLKDSGAKNSWTQVVSIFTNTYDRWPHGVYQPITYLNNGALLMFHIQKCALICYDPRKRGFKYFKIHGTKSKVEAIAYTPTFSSLKDALLGYDVQVLNINSRCAGLKLQGEGRAFSLVEENIEMEDDSDTYYEDDEWSLD